MSDHLDQDKMDQTPISYTQFRVIKDNEGKPVDFEVLNANTALAQILGLDPQQVIGKRLKEVDPGSAEFQADLVDALTRIALAGGTEMFTQYVNQLKAWFKVSIFTPEKDSIIAFFSDISLSMKQLSDSDVFFNISPNLLSILKMDGRFIKVNHSWQMLLGYAQEDVVNADILEFVHPENYKETVTIKRQFAENQINNIHFINRFRHKDGSYLYLEWDANSDGQKIYAIARDITERIEWENQIEYLSYHDVLTGLYNRRFLEEEIKRLDTDRNLPISIIMGDINRLKLVNDAFGHDKGDEFIILAAEAIKTSCRLEDLVARWGGDEFIIFLPKTNASDAEKIAHRIQANCADKQVNSITVSVSLGIATKTASDEVMSGIIREAENNMYKAKNMKSERSRNDIINAVINALYQKEPYEEKHAKRVSDLCKKTALILGYSEKEVKKLALAGLMHDIGKVAVSVQILKKPSQLTEDEWEEVKKHAEIGYRVVDSLLEMADIGNAILAHHERPDGKGYPKGILRDKIPVSARIIALADSYDTMTGQGLYRKIFSKEEAIAEIRRNAGTQFDPQIAELFIEKVLSSEPASEEIE
jgi:diguanylate cyclase (GGDEF)-like protein/PAS domain S-box-containing protein